MLFGLEPGKTLHIYYWVSRIWPVIAPMVFILVFRQKIRNPVAYYVFGALVCIGIYTIVGELLVNLPYHTPEAFSLGERLVQIIAAATGRAILVSIILGMAALYWLYRIYAFSPPKNVYRDSGSR